MTTALRRGTVAFAMATMLCSPQAARADEQIKLGLSVPLSGSGAIWGKAIEWLCKKAAQEIRSDGGIKVNDKIYNVECIAYDNKYNAADGTKVAQTLLNRDGVKYIYGFGTAAILATQSLSERQGAMLFNTSWGKNSKGRKFPLTFTVGNSPIEIMPAMVKFITQAHPEAKTMVLLNANDASGRETEVVSRPLWEKAGIKILASDFYERGTTEFQPIATRIASLKPDIVNLSSAPPADAGQIFKELDVLGFKGIKITDNGTGSDGLMTTGGNAVNGVYMGAAMTFDGAMVSDHQRKLNEEARAYLGESLSLAEITGYDTVYILKAGIEKAQSIEPKDVAAVLPSVSFRTFYGGETGFGGTEDYGAKIQALLPVYVTQIVDGKLVERSRIDPRVR